MKKFHDSLKPIYAQTSSGANALFSADGKKVQVGNDEEKAQSEQSEKDSHSKNRGGKQTKITI